MNKKILFSSAGVCIVLILAFVWLQKQDTEYLSFSTASYTVDDTQQGTTTTSKNNIKAVLMQRTNNTSQFTSPTSTNNSAGSLTTTNTSTTPTMKSTNIPIKTINTNPTIVPSNPIPPTTTKSIPPNNISNYDATIRIMTYDLGVSDRFFLKNAYPNPAYKKYSVWASTLVQYIIDNEIDIIAFQQAPVDNDKPHDRDRMLFIDALEQAGYYVSEEVVRQSILLASSINPDGAHPSNLIVSKYPIVSSWTHTPNGPSDQHLAGADIALPNGKTLTVLTHNPIPGYRKKPQHARYQDYIIQLANNYTNKEQLILLGNFNIDPKRQSHQKVYNQITQAWDLENFCDTSPDKTCTVTVDPLSMKQISYSAAVDHIMGRGYNTIPIITYSDHDLFLSDHYAVITDLVIQ